MNTDDKRRHLGRGLSALLGDDGIETASSDASRPPRFVALDLLRPGRFQPRRRFVQEEMDSLEASIREKGVIQPILVRKTSDQAYEIIAGERRWRAAQRAGLHELPVVVRELNDREALEIALVENVQRADLSPIEEALGYQRLMTEFDHTQEQLSKVVGKSRSHVANLLRLLDLPPGVKTLLDGGKISAGHARALLGVENAETLARQIVARNLNVRQTERLTQLGKKRNARKQTLSAKDTDTLALERELSALLGLKVTLKPSGKAGDLSIRYESLEQLDDVVQRLSAKPA
ncbi:MAG: ParB/RepB/Spo0J family partition protein [Alphaproteobacteria bacterium]|nr:ParB/RepB/Spo0J family partition protein [Alphaproteobacteria bacterium]